MYTPPTKTPFVSKRSLVSLAPNMMTLLNLCLGLSAVRFAFSENWKIAAAACVAAAACDGIDGRLARLMRVTSNFGGQLDSLADAIAFGVAPALVVYLWSAQQLGDLGWVAALIFASCCVLRLARFNATSEEDLSAEATPSPARQHRFFVGLPAPAGAGLVVLPMILSFFSNMSLLHNPFLTTINLIFVGLLMISRIPTYSLKSLSFPRRRRKLALLLMLVMSACLLSAPWKTLSALGVLYVLSIPFAWTAQQRLQKRSATEKKGGNPKIRRNSLRQNQP